MILQLYIEVSKSFLGVFVVLVSGLGVGLGELQLGGPDLLPGLTDLLVGLGDLVPHLLHNV